MSVFYVFQGVTYEKEKAGGYVWSPQLTKNGKKNAGFSNMTKIKKDDFILHNQNGKVVAISVALSDCEEVEQPSELMVGDGANLWSKEGYRVAVSYYPFDIELETIDFREWLIKNHKKNSAFTVKGKGKQQYMCTLAEEHAVYILEKAIDIQKNNATLIHLNTALTEIVDDKELEYSDIDMDIINLTLDEIDKVDASISVAEEQATKLSSSTGRRIPKRNPKRAAEALAIAEYKCEYNETDRTFIRRNGKQYTEPHHLIPISKYEDFDRSVDVKENIVSLCSHCHNLLHYGIFEEKIAVLNKLYKEREDRIRTYGIDLTLEQLAKYYK